MSGVRVDVLERCLAAAANEGLHLGRAAQGPARGRRAAARVLRGAYCAVVAAGALSSQAASSGADRGACESIAPVAAFTVAQMDAMVKGLGTEAQLYAPARCGVSLSRVVFMTVAPDGSAAKASAGLALPTGCGTALPLVEFNHGTWTTTGLSMSDASQLTVREAMAQFAAQGYAILMPDYLGYDTSTLNYHPYLQADSAADVSIDAVRAARACLGRTDTLGSSIYVAGISEGGYVAMATVRAMEAQHSGEFDVVASVSATGPYALADSTMEMIEADDGVSGYALMQLQGYQNAYGDVYRQPSDVYQQPYAGEPRFTHLLPNPQTLPQLIHERRLPRNLEGSHGLLTSDFVQRYESNPAEPARVHAQQNDLRTFVPRAPLSMCFGSPDTHATANALMAQAWFLSQGVGVGMGDIEEMVQYLPFILAMGGHDYHSSVEAPVCMAWAREYVFDLIRRER